MDVVVVHDKSSVETVTEFFCWMYRKALNDKETIYGRVEDVIYEIDMDPRSLDKAFEQYADYLKEKKKVL